MQVLILIGNIFGVGGMERATCQLANTLQAVGYQVTILSIWLNADKPYFPLDPAVKLRKLLEKPPGLIELYLKLPGQIRQVIKQTSAEHIIVSDSQLSVSAVLASYGQNGRLLVWEHFHSQMGARFGSRWLGRWFSALFADDIVVLTERDKASWIQKFRCPRKLHVVPNFLTCPLSTTAYDPRSRIVLAVGRFCEVKGFDLLVKAWALLPLSYRQHWRLRIIGARSAFKTEVALLVSKMDLADSIELCDPTHDIVSQYQQAAMLVVSSRNESFGLVITEALANKLPVLSFDCPMGPMDILQNKYGVCVPAEDISALAQQMTNLMDQPQLRQHFSDAGFERAKDYTEEKIVGLWIKLL
jgi:glycosyltransferase involved in cell wall biosynthesis